MSKTKSTALVSMPNDPKTIKKLKKPKVLEEPKGLDECIRCEEPKKKSKESKKAKRPKESDRIEAHEQPKKVKKSKRAKDPKVTELPKEEEEPDKRKTAKKSEKMKESDEFMQHKKSKRVKHPKEAESAEIKDPNLPKKHKKSKKIKEHEAPEEPRESKKSSKLTEPKEAKGSKKKSKTTKDSAGTKESKKSKTVKNPKEAESAKVGDTKERNKSKKLKSSDRPEHSIKAKEPKEPKATKASKKSKKDNEFDKPDQQQVVHVLKDPKENETVDSYSSQNTDTETNYTSIVETDSTEMTDPDMHHLDVKSIPDVKDTTTNEVLEAQGLQGIHLEMKLEKLADHKLYLCTECKISFLTVTQMRSHVLLEHYAKEYSFSCNECPKNYLNSTDLYKHKQLRHNPEYKYRCPHETCHQRIDRKQYFKLHLKRHESQEIHTVLECPVCTLNLGSLRMIRKHVIRDHPDFEGVPCEVCNERFAHVVERDTHSILKHPMEKEFVCKDANCGKRYKTIGNLIEHYQSTGHDPKATKPFPCPVCPLGYAHLKSLKNHILNNHYGEVELVPCKLCVKSFSCQAEYEEHVIKYHNPTFRFTCDHPGCELRFETEAKASRHACFHSTDPKDIPKQKHNGMPKPIYCPECRNPYQFYNLKRHIKKKHPDAPQYPCPKCPQICLFKKEWGRHMLVRHNPENVYVCDYPLCNRHYDTERHLWNHKTTQRHLRPFPKPGNEYLCVLK
ncbi:hypothetical protein BJV82DRAFT_715219 [Fennellomyces sp. T-0311]|nr:hypothetical protein BJV82DRAFT_715219 [Fennellomyces sp. T-0311]